MVGHAVQSQHIRQKQACCLSWLSFPSSGFLYFGGTAYFHFLPETVLFFYTPPKKGLIFRLYSSITLQVTFSCLYSLSHFFVGLPIIPQWPKEATFCPVSKSFFHFSLYLSKSLLQSCLYISITLDLVAFLLLSSTRWWATTQQRILPNLMYLL